MSQFLILIPMAPVGTQLILAVYGGTYRLTGTVNGKHVFSFDLSPTYAVPFGKVVAATTRGEDASMTATVWLARLSSAAGMLTLHAEGLGEGAGRVDWTLGPDAAGELETWIEG